MGRVITHCQTQKINISEGKVLKSQQFLKFNHLVIGYHWTVISWAVFADSLWANLMMGKSTLLQSVFVVLLWFGKVIFLPFMEKNQTADWSGWCRCMTFFHHLPKFQTMGLQISDHGLHKTLRFPTTNCRKTQIFRKWIASEKTHLQWSLSELQNVSQSQIFVPVWERERLASNRAITGREQHTYLLFHPTFLLFCSSLEHLEHLQTPKQKTVSQFSSIARSAPSIEWGQFIRVTVLPLPLVDPIPHLVFSKFRHPRRIHCVQAVCQSTTAAAGAVSLSLQIILQDFHLPKP
jgi:hypothetical protein